MAIRIDRDAALLAVRHLLAGHGIRGAARAAGINQRTAIRINKEMLGGSLRDLIAEAKRSEPPSKFEAMPEKRRARLGQMDGAGRVVEALPAQAKPHPMRPDPNRRRGRPLRTESGRLISHEEVLVRLVATANGGWRGMGEGAGI